MTDFLRPVAFTKIAKVTGVERTRAIRIYCTQSVKFGADARWSLQVRGPATLANGSDGRDFIVATASLSLGDLRALRAAIDELLAEVP